MKMLMLFGGYSPLDRVYDVEWASREVCFMMGIVTTGGEYIEHVLLSNHSFVLPLEDIH
jgi:hypothetical protein